MNEVKMNRAIFSLSFLASTLLATTTLADPPAYGPAEGLRIGFGNAVAVGDDLVFVGEPLNESSEGTVYVFRRAAEGWDEVARLTAEDGAPGDRFGTSLAVDGGTLVVGSMRTDEARGAAYVFEREPGSDGWRQAAKLVAAGAAAGDSLGIAIAVDGGTILVGAARAGGGGGAVYAFERRDGAWVEVDRLVAADAGPEDRFGRFLALEDGVALVGATRHDDGRGAVYAFRSESGGWVQSAKLVPPGEGANDRFGSAIALEGGRALVGALGHDQFRGIVYDLELDPATGAWTERGRLVPEGATPQAFFGGAIAYDGTTAMIGAPGAAGFEGRVFVFQREGGGWSEPEALAAPELQAGDQFAGSLAARDRVAAFGVPGDDFGLGAAAIFERNGNGGWAVAARVVGEGSSLEPVVGGPIDCAGGAAAGFECQAVDLVAFLPVEAIGGGRGIRTNDVWGWTDPETGKEYALVGRVDGTAFVDVSDPVFPVYVGELPRTPTSPASTWRDMKVYRDHAFIVADGAGAHGMQVFDLTRLREFGGETIEFEPDARYDRIASAHNIAINEDTGFAYAVGNSGGGETCGGGLHMIDIRDPKNPVFAGCFADPATGQNRTGYTHDATCVTYRGPDEEHQGREICFGANETALSIADVTDKEAPRPLAAAEYPNVGYAHQAWLTEDHRYLYLDDELDELNGLVDRTRTLIWDVSDLDDPVLVKEHLGTTASIDHNLYVVGNRMYQSNYVAGLRILDISDPVNPVEIGYFDTVPWGDDAPRFDGSWSNYPFFESGTIVVTSGREGVFLLRFREGEREIS